MRNFVIGTALLAIMSIAAPSCRPRHRLELQPSRSTAVASAATCSSPKRWVAPGGRHPDRHHARCRLPAGAVRRYLRPDREMVTALARSVTSNDVREPRLHRPERRIEDNQYFMYIFQGSEMPLNEAGFVSTKRPSPVAVGLGANRPDT